MRRFSLIEIVPEQISDLLTLVIKAQEKVIYSLQTDHEDELSNISLLCQEMCNVWVDAKDQLRAGQIPPEARGSVRTQKEKIVFLMKSVQAYLDVGRWVDLQDLESLKVCLGFLRAQLD